VDKTTLKNMFIVTIQLIFNNHLVSFSLSKKFIFIEQMDKKVIHTRIVDNFLQHFFYSTFIITYYLFVNHGT